MACTCLLSPVKHVKRVNMSLQSLCGGRGLSERGRAWFFVERISRIHQERLTLLNLLCDTFVEVFHPFLFLLCVVWVIGKKQKKNKEKKSKWLVQGNLVLNTFPSSPRSPCFSCSSLSSSSPPLLLFPLFSLLLSALTLSALPHSSNSNTWCFSCDHECLRWCNNQKSVLDFWEKN